MSNVGVLKLARGAELNVARSALVFVDDDGKVEGCIEDAFGLRPGQRLDGPFYDLRHDDRERPPRAAAMSWELNDLRSLSTPLPSLAEPRDLALLWLPLHVPVAQDRQLVAQFVNHTSGSVDWVEAVRSAVLVVDGVRHPSLTGWHWDGRRNVDPGGTSRRAFAMADFQGAPTLGLHVVSLEMAGFRTDEQRIELRGEPAVTPA